jgi:hypothetical protein
LPSALFDDQTYFPPSNCVHEGRGARRPVADKTNSQFQRCRLPTAQSLPFRPLGVRHFPLAAKNRLHPLSGSGNAATSFTSPPQRFYDLLVAARIGAAVICGSRRSRAAMRQAGAAVFPAIKPPKLRLVLG